MNAPPQGQDSLDDIDARSTAALEAEIATKAEAARRQVAGRYPGESGKAETDQGKATMRQLGIGKP
jgi:hypothetical protein